MAGRVFKPVQPRGPLPPKAPAIAQLGVNPKTYDVTEDFMSPIQRAKQPRASALSKLRKKPTT